MGVSVRVGLSADLWVLLLDGTYGTYGTYVPGHMSLTGSQSPATRMRASWLLAPELLTAYCLLLTAYLAQSLPNEQRYLLRSRSS